MKAITAEDEYDLGYISWCPRCGPTSATYVDQHDFGTHITSNMRCLRCKKTYLVEGSKRRDKQSK